MHRAVSNYWSTRPRWLRRAILLGLVVLLVAAATHAANLLESAKWILIGGGAGVVSFALIMAGIRHIFMFPISLGLTFSALIFLLLHAGRDATKLSSHTDSLFTQVGVFSSAVLGFCITAWLSDWSDRRGMERRERQRQQKRERQQRRQRERQQLRKRKKLRRAAR